MVQYSFFHPIHSNPGQTYSQPHDETCIWWRDGRFTFPSNYSGVFDNMKWIITFAPTNDRGVAQLASAHVWGTWGRKFESSHPDQSSTQSAYKQLVGFFHSIIAPHLHHELSKYGNISMFVWLAVVAVWGDQHRPYFPVFPYLVSSLLLKNTNPPLNIPFGHFPFLNHW